MSFAARIKQARKARKMTQTQLGEMIGVAKSTIAGYEKGTSHPDEAKMVKMMAALGVDANYLFQDIIDVGAQANTKIHPDAQRIARAYMEAPPPIQRTVDVALEPYMTAKDAKKAPPAIKDASGEYTNNPPQYLAAVHLHAARAASETSLEVETSDSVRHMVEDAKLENNPVD